jgi:spore maturation protein CgeB
LKILFAGLKYDYGVIERGVSLESKTFVPSLNSNASQFLTFWFEENGFPDRIELLQKNLIDFAIVNSPDIIFFVLMNNEVSITTLNKLKEKFITINWFCDDTWRFHSFSKFIAPHFTYSITNDKFSLNKYKTIGYKNVILSQWASIDYDNTLSLKNIEYKYDITFVGGKNPTREWIINELIKNDLKVECFGTGWENGRVSFSQMKEIFLHSKINLNLSNSVPSQLSFLKYLIKGFFLSFFSIKTNKNLAEYLNNIKLYLQGIKFYFFAAKTSEQIKARNFEIPGFGGFQLSQYTLELEDYFSIGNEIAIFSNTSELIQQCKYYLENSEIRESICFNGYRRTEFHNYNDRIKSILNHIKSNNQFS